MYLPLLRLDTYYVDEVYSRLSVGVYYTSTVNYLDWVLFCLEVGINYLDWVCFA